MISVEGLKVEFNATPLFEDVSYVINKKDRIALVGKNGAGKSTMLKILAGIQQPTAGIVAVPRECTIGYLPQVMILSDKRTVMQEAELAFEHIFEMQAGIERMNRQLAERTDYDSEGYTVLVQLHAVHYDFVQVTDFLCHAAGFVLGGGKLFNQSLNLLAVVFCKDSKRTVL